MTAEVEPVYLARAAEQLEAHLATATQGRTTAWAHYVRADIARRAAQKEKARNHYRAVLATNGAEERLQELSSWFLERL